MLKSAQEKLSHWGNQIWQVFEGREDLENLSSFSKLQDSLTVHKISSLLPYSGYDPETQIFLNDQCVGCVFEVSPLVGCTEEMQRELSGLFQTTLPEGSAIQFSLYADPRIEGLMGSWKEARNNQDPLYQTLAQKRFDSLQSRVFQGFMPLRNFRCWVAYSQEGSVENPVLKQKFLSTRDQIQTSLETAGLLTNLWTAHDLVQTLDGLINFKPTTYPSKLTWDESQLINQQIPSSETLYQITKDGLVLNEGESQIKTYSVRSEPEYWSLHAMGELIGHSMRDSLQVPYPFLMHYGIGMARHDRIRNYLDKKEDWVERQAHSRIGKKIPIIMKQHREFGFVREQLSKGERFVEGSLSVSILGPQAGFDNAEQTLHNLFRSNGWTLQREKYIPLQSFLAQLPMAWGEGIPDDLRYHRRLKTTLSSESANLLPLQGEWKGNGAPNLLLTGRKGQMFTWSPFNNEEGNYNVCVVGKSGSGKSVFMQELVVSNLGTGGQVFVIDVGRSFEKTVKLLGGTYLEFNTKSTLCLNPFTNIPMEDPALVEDTLAMLKPVIAAMTSPREGVSDLEYALIEKGLKHGWDQKQTQAGITDVADYLKEQSSGLAQSLGEKLFPYTNKGIYGRFFNGPCTVDLDHPFVVIELEELKERKDLQDVIVQMIIVQITNQIYLGDRKTLSHIVLDEAWDLLRGKQSGLFIETAARRLRKYKGSLVVGTQSVNDFYATPAAQAAFENADWMCLLAQKKESIAQLKKSKRIEMDPSMEKLLKSVKTQQGKYAEVMIYGPHGYAIGRLLLDPFSLILYSTKAEEFAAVQTLTEQGMTLPEAIQKVATQKFGKHP